MSALGGLVESRLPLALALEWPGGRAGAPGAKVRLRLADRRALRWLAQGRIGHIADAYVRGLLDIDGAMPDVMKVAGDLAGDPRREGRSMLQPRWLARWLAGARHDRQSDARQVQFHYDVCDEFFGLWLDEQRVYSCAYFRDADMDLAAAQRAKLELICRKLRLQPGQRFLDIGAGWGALLLWAAEHHGVHATGITLSRHQHAHVNRLIDERGLRGRVEMLLLDYRDLSVNEPFDRIASVGMFEHVGRAQLGDYFSRLRGLLKPGGLMLNHGITAAAVGIEQLGAGLGDFIDQHIFPGGELVHVSEVAHHMADGGLELLDAENLRPHYARTLWSWSDALEQRLDEAAALVSEPTLRAYRMYLAGSAMAFERGWLSIYQLLASRPDGQVQGGALAGAQSDYPFNRAYMHSGN